MSSRKILIRVDSSHKIGTGHVMRCLTLANDAQKTGWEVGFVCREISDDNIKLVRSNGHQVWNLSSKYIDKSSSKTQSAYDDWLAVSQEQDAKQTLDIILRYRPQWIIVDHYSLDSRWLRSIQRGQAKTLVIDDLGNRDFFCDVLLDQNLGASEAKYKGRISSNCCLLLGPDFALLRSEFRVWRERSLKERFGRGIKNVLITMGGVDAENYTLRVLREMSKSKYANSCIFTVIIGGSYLHQKTLEKFVVVSGLKISILSKVTNMAEIMSNSDLCIGAAGSTSWERCCLGQPTITLSIADNQREIAEQLHQRNVAIFSDIGNLRADFDAFFSMKGIDLLKELSANSSAICDGYGARRVIDVLEKSIEN